MCIFKPKIPKVPTPQPPPVPAKLPDPPGPKPEDKPLKTEEDQTKVSYGTTVRKDSNQRATGTQSLRIPLNTGLGMGVGAQGGLNV